VDAREALAKLDPNPNHILRRLASLVARQSVFRDGPARDPSGGYRQPASPKPTKEHAVAGPGRRRAAELLGFTRLGAVRTGVLFLPGVEGDVFTDADATVTLSMGPRLEAFCTYFDDGACVMTWSQLPTSGPRNQTSVASRKAIASTGETGTGDLADDLVVHQAAVARRVMTGRTPLRIHNIDVYGELAAHYLRREVPLSIARVYVFMAATPIAVILIGVVYVASRLVR
jgi:hypothetical protein